MSEDITPINTGFYQHYKGGIYMVIASALSTETGETMHVYKNLLGQHFVRPHSSWVEPVVVGDDSTPRFIWLGQLMGEALASLEQFSKTDYSLLREIQDRVDAQAKVPVAGDACPECNELLFEHDSGDLHCRGCSFIHEVM